MLSRITNTFTAYALIGVWAVLLTGCSKQVPPAPVENTQASGHSHGGWWCGEHGVPEEVCARCDTSLVDDFKAKNDWCNEHERPDSQCFVCHPELEARFAAQYKAKYGKQPPKPSDEGEHGHEHEHSHEHDDDHKHDEKS